MNVTTIAALFAAAALPVAVAAQTATPRAQAPQKSPQARLQQESKPTDGRLTPRERARLAKEQNKQKKIAKQKLDKQKKAPAS
jgi:hypothetical protein